MIDDEKPSATKPRGLENMYKIQLRDLIAMQIAGGMESTSFGNQSVDATSEDFWIYCYKAADMALKVRNER